MFFSLRTCALAAILLELLIPREALADDIISAQIRRGEQERFLKTYELEVGASYEDLSGNYQDWRVGYLDFSATLGPNKVVYGSVRDVERFNIKDDEYNLGLYYPLPKNFLMLADATQSSTHYILPRSAYLLQIEHSLPAGFYGGLGYKKTEYNSSRTAVYNLKLERYWSSYRAAFIHYYSDVENIGTSSTNAVQASYYYGLKNLETVSHSNGKELEDIGVRGVLASKITEYFLSGRYWITERWGITHELGYREQGRSYIKRWVRFGIRFHF